MFGLLMVFAVTIYAFHRSREMTALVFMALAPLKYFSQNVGILLSPAKLMGLLFLVYIIFNPRCLTLLKNKYLGAFLPFYLYTIYLTFIMANFWPDYSVAQQSFLYGNAMRSIVQIFLSIMGLAIVIRSEERRVGKEC